MLQKRANMIYQIVMEVRDNEIDMQGVVNNANYFIYFAHARHKFIQEQLNISFTEMTEKKQMLFLLASQIDFKQSLRPGEIFTVTCELLPVEKRRILFKQEILKAQNVVAASAINTTVCLDGNNRNRPYIPQVITDYLAQT